MTDSEYRPKSHIAKPPQFDGKNLTKFEQSCKLYTFGNRRDFPDDETKILMALSYMQESDLPSKWAQNFIRPKLDAAVPVWGTWTDFWKKVEEAFGDPNKTRNADQALSGLRQGLMTATEFFQKFEIYRSDAGYTANHDQHLICLLEKALNKGLIDVMYNAETIPTTYEEFRDKAIRIDGNLQRRKAADTRFNASTPNTFKAQKPATTTTTTTQVVQTKRDATGTIFGGAGQPMEISEAKRKGLCFKCGVKGHMSRDCPNRNKVEIRQIVGGMTAELKKEWLEALGAEAVKGSESAPASGFVQPQQ